MSKYVKEMMMDQLRSDLDGSRSVLIVDLSYALLYPRIRLR